MHSHHPAPDRLGHTSVQFLPLSAQQRPAEQYQRVAMILSVVLTKIMMSSIVIKRQRGCKGPCGAQGIVTFPENGWRLRRWLLFLHKLSHG